MQSVTLELRGGLADLATGAADGVVEVAMTHPRSVKDAVESARVPHTEVGAVRVDGVEVGWDHLLAGSERVVAFDIEDDGEAPAPVPPGPLRFVADVHLGTLARRLRVLGFDTAWSNDADDDALVATMQDEARVLLSRDRGLLMRRVVVHGALVRHDDPDTQLRQLATRFDLAGRVAVGTRCPRCNEPVDRVARGEVVDHLEEGTRAADYDRFGRCRGCGRIYWSGAHADALEAIAARVR